MTNRNIKAYINNINKVIKKKYTNSYLNYSLRLKYSGSNTIINIPLNVINEDRIKNLFKKKHFKTYGFYYEDRKIVLDSLEAESSNDQKLNFNFKLNCLNERKEDYVTSKHKILSKNNKSVFTKSINSNSFKNKSPFKGLVLFNDFNTTLVIEKDWKIKKKKKRNL